jgi:hypothetical protein
LQREAAVVVGHEILRHGESHRDVAQRLAARGDFLGSGTTVIAAERTGRRCCGLELDPAYVDTIIRRWQALTGGTAHHAASGRSFDDLARKAEVANAA